MSRSTWWFLAFGGIVLASGLAGKTQGANDDKKGAEVSLGSLKSKAPADWKQVEPEQMFRTDQFKVPKAKGDKTDADLIIFFFGKGGGGSAEQNVQRWKDMF